MYALNIAEDKRILSACIVLPNGNYTDMPLVDTLPDGNVYDYCYIDNQYVYNPLPQPEEPEPEATVEERVTELETALTLLLEGATE